MGLSKRGFYIDHGRACVGKLHVVDIGIPKEAIETVGVRDNVLTMRDAAELLPARPFDGHKGTFGRVVVVAGSVGYTGAAALTALSALRTGAGLVHLGVPSSLNDIMETKLTEVMTKPLAETAARSLSPESLPDVRELLENAEALALGPGISRDQETQSLVRSIVAEMSVPCVIDADGLNALTPEKVGQRTGNAPVVLTPHPGEMARLTGRTVGEVLADREGVARDVAAKARATVVVAAPSGELYMNPTGNSGLASGGTGDVLTGIIAGLLGQGVAATDAAALGAFVHGLAGDLAAEALGEAGMIAGDVLDHVPYALMEIGGANR
jgi:NAD(P)H-hydrate epimerase